MMSNINTKDIAIKAAGAAIGAVVGGPVGVVAVPASIHVIQNKIKK